jgi:hypothetical protein
MLAACKWPTDPCHPHAKAAESRAVEVVTTRPTDADSAAIEHLSAQERKDLPQVTYLVKIRLKAIPEPTREGRALYADDFSHPEILGAQGRDLLLSIRSALLPGARTAAALANGSNFTNTRLKLPAPPSGRPARLPLHEQLLKQWRVGCSCACRSQDGARGSL